MSLWLVTLGVLASLLPMNPAYSADTLKTKQPIKPKTKTSIIPLNVTANLPFVLQRKDGLVPDMVLGNPKAPISIVVYASPSCGHCGHWHKDVLPLLKSNYVAKGKVKLIWRDVSTQPYQYALNAALIGRCLVNKTPNNKNASAYFKVIDAFYEAQESFFATGRGAEALTKASKATGYSTLELAQCIGEEALFEQLTHTMMINAQVDNITQTPTFFVNGTKITKHEWVDLEAAIKMAKPIKP
jgi:protein-disulfide isomerase